MEDFEWFKQQIKRKGVVWKSECVHFLDCIDNYMAVYAPLYPDHSPEEQYWFYNIRDRKFTHICAAH